MASRAPDRSVVDVLQDVVGNIQEIIHAEFLLFRTEVREELENARGGAILLVIAVFFALSGAVFLLLALVHRLAESMSETAAAATVGGCLIACAVLALVAGRSQLRRTKLLPKTVQSLTEIAK